MDCSGLARKWDEDAAVRSHCREARDLLKLPVGAKWVEPTRANAVAHKTLLLPALAILRETPGQKLPYLANLQCEIRDTYMRLVGDADEKLVYRNAQELKRLMGLVKRKAVKKEVTKDLGLSMKTIEHTKRYI